MSLFQHTLASLALTLSALLYAGSSFALSEGMPAPALDGKLLDGTAISLASLKGNVVIINLWASWCSPCRSEMPAIEQYYQQHRAEGLKVIAISTDDPQDEKDVRALMSRYTFPAALIRDIKMDGYGEIWRMPMTFIVDQNGILRKDGSVGEPKVDLALLEREVTPLLHPALPTSPATTKQP
jgi:thiol-disulfide isomerase/thioredoxin